MNNRHISTAGLLAMVVGSALLPAGCKSTSEANKKSVSEYTEILFADPTIFVENGKYYLTGTRNSEPLGFTLLESDNLKHWKAITPDSLVLKCGEGVYGTKGFWAPQILRVNNKYWMTYTANEQTALATADSIKSLFTQKRISPIDDSEKNIDSFLFKDSDGKWYLYHVRFNRGNYLWVAEFNPERGEILKETLKPCFRNDQPWEHTGSYPSDPIMEGPTVLKLDDHYYLFYSANHFMSEDYAVGYAVADNPTGPWSKNPNNPIISKTTVGEKGSGHGDIFKDNAGRYRYVYHVHNSDIVVSPRRTRIITLDFAKDPTTGYYDITADTSSIIKPQRSI